jgi:hypothetical protein
MKRLTLLFTLAIAVFNFSAKAQNVIAVEHSGVSAFYQSLDTAMIHAVSGDMVYLPATSYNVGNFHINKGVHLVGAGCNPDSSSATGITLFNGTVYITTGADNGSMEGIYINGDLNFGSSPSDQVINMYSVNRCAFNALYLSYNGSSTSASTNLNINESIIKGIILCGNTQNTVISKCIIEGYMAYISGATTLTNNVFLKNPCGGEYMFSLTSAAIVQNNIFILALCNYFEPYQFLTTGSGNTFNHNLFIVPNPIPLGNVSDGNIYSVQRDSIFMNQTGNTYNVLHNYHLKNTCAGKNAGTDGTDIGLYGTASPKKDGEIPFNPHVQTKVIPASTNSQGNLDVIIKVKAQDN